MSKGANVRSVDAIRDFKLALINFAEDAQNALGSVEMEIRQIRNWLVRDQLSYWQSQIKRGQERVSMTRTELHRRQLMKTGSDAISDTEQKEALREAQRKLREAEEKVITIKKWIPIFEHALSEYHSQSQPLGDRLSGSFAATLNLLDRMLAALDSYLAMAPPSAPAAPRLRAAAEESEREAKSTAAAAGTGDPGQEPEPAAGVEAAGANPSQAETAEFVVRRSSEPAPAQGLEQAETAEYDSGSFPSR
jgi:hypothetical protein